MLYIIAGGSGLVGSRLARILTEQGHEAVILTRHSRPSGVKGLSFEAWDVQAKKLPPIMSKADVLINLAGANVGSHRWSKKYKEEIIKSRTESTALLVDFLNTKPHNIKVLINASAIGYYGTSEQNAATEDTPAGNDFMARVCVEWEHEAHKLNHPNTRLLIARLGIVLSAEGGALDALAKPAKILGGVVPGTGSQTVPWIHIDDVCNALLFLAGHENLSGAFNLVSPAVNSEKDIVKAICRILRRPVLLPVIPNFLLKIVLGEFADTVVKGRPVSGDKIKKAGFQFRYPELESCLQNILENKRS